MKDKKPSWLRVSLPKEEEMDLFHKTKGAVRRHHLNTVCEEARCPNIFECWSMGTATFMIMGETCTRSCRFCCVHSGHPKMPLDAQEPKHVGLTIRDMNLSYVVLTMVDRDDLVDGGCSHLIQTILQTRYYSQDVIIEILVGDFCGSYTAVDRIVREGNPDVFAHNVEVVPRLQKTIRDARCSWKQSVEVLAIAKEIGARITKSSLMLGLGESKDEVIEAMGLLRDVHVDVLTIGQYLQPTLKHAKVERYVHPDEFEEYRRLGTDMGFVQTYAGPLVRSSYRAAELFIQGLHSNEQKASTTFKNEKHKRHLSVVKPQ